MAEPEKFKLENFDINKLFSQSFLKELAELEYFPISVVLVSEIVKDDKVVSANLLSISYSTHDEAVKKIVHIEGNDSKVLQKLVSTLEKD